MLFDALALGNLGRGFSSQLSRCIKGGQEGPFSKGVHF
jgi:hypothetical protein